MKRLLIASVIAAGLTSGTASAATLSYDYTNHAPAAFGAGYTFSTTNWNALLNLPKFNSAALPAGFTYTLTGAALSWGGEFQTTGQIDSEDAEEVDAEVNVGVRLRFRGDGTFGSTAFGFSPSNVNLADTLFAGTLAADDEVGLADFLGLDSATGLTAGDGNFPQVFNIANLAAVTGAGVFDVFTDAVSSLQIVGTANLSSDILTEARSQIGIVYSYTATPDEQRVPEPGSIALVGLALAGLGLVRRRKA